jgi:hypothetical protein
MWLSLQGPLIPKEHNQPDLPAFWRAPDMSPVQKKKIAKMSKQERTNAFLVGEYFKLRFQAANLVKIFLIEFDAEERGCQEVEEGADELLPGR